jgi:trigger factor
LRPEAGKRPESPDDEIMQSNIEILGALQRRVDLSLPSAEVLAEVDRRIARIARDSQMPGFRRGKVPVKMIARQHGAQVQAEVVSDRVGELLGRTLEQSRLRLAGRPQIEMRPPSDAGQLEFRATFEVYPEVVPPDLSALQVRRAVCPIGDEEIDKTLEVMRRQRATLRAVEREARDGDRVTIDFRGTIDGIAFDGGTATGYSFELGRGRMLPEFEQACRGLAAGAAHGFDLSFPADYHGKDVAGRTARFDITMHKVEERVLPAIDADFARALGVGDGDLARLREEVRESVEREVTMRLRARTRESVLEALSAASTFDVPRALLSEEQERLRALAQAEIEARGGGAASAGMPGPEVFAGAALRRVRLALVVGEIVRRQGLQARPEQVREAIGKLARSYEKPEQVVQWYLGDRGRYGEVESQVLEDNVIDHVLSGAKLQELPVAFDELMEGAKAAPGGSQ